MQAQAVQTIPTTLDGPVLIQPRAFPDERGFFCETYRQQWHTAVGIPEGDQFIQDNHSRSAKGVVRGMHFHVGPGVAKLVRCARGCILDVLVDLRAGSPTYGQWEGYELDDVSMRLLYAPIGFAHGFCVLSETADVIYKQTAYYDPDLERGISWCDPDIGIEWPTGIQLIVSERDVAAPTLAEIADQLPFRYHPSGTHSRIGSTTNATSQLTDRDSSQSGRECSSYVDPCSAGPYQRNQRA